jgi:Ni,Fe-hydrogenase III large subunit
LSSALHHPVLCVSLADLPRLDLAGLMQACSEHIHNGARVLTLFGRLQTLATKDVVLTAVFQSPSLGLVALQGHAQADDSYDSLTLRHPAMHIFERELWEQTGITPVGHPWLKPVRYERDRQQQMSSYPFFKVRGAEVHEVGVGPIHASVIEPGHFRFMCLGERVQHLEIQLGYQHRGVEALLLQRPPLALTPLVESIAGDTSVAYAVGYCAAIEALAGTKLSAGATLVRGVALELERIAIHLASVTGLAGDIAFLQGGATYGRLRTAIINASMRCCGSRFGHSWVRPGGVRFGLDAERRADLKNTLAAFAKDLADINALMLNARTVRPRLQGIGQLPINAAQDLGLWGLVARASGLHVDVRACLPGQLYSHFPVEEHTETGRDCWALLRLRLKEIESSVRWINRALESSALQDAVPSPLPLPALRSSRLCVSVCEGPRGPVLHALETDGSAQLAHYKVQDPSLQTWFALAMSLRDNDISDFPICNKSFDLSYCGNDL